MTRADPDLSARFATATLEEVARDARTTPTSPPASPPPRWKRLLVTCVCTPTSPPASPPPRWKRLLVTPAEHDHDRELDLSAPRTVHIVGVGGAGMSAFATVLVRMGHRVSGSDLRESRALERLRALGVDAHVGHDAANVPDDVDAADLHRGPRRTPRCSRPTISRSRCCAAPTRCARSSHCAGPSRSREATARPRRRRCSRSILRAAGWHPSFLIGGDLNEVGTNASWTTANGWWSRPTRATARSSSSRRGGDRHQRRGGPPRPLRRLPCARRRIRAVPRRDARHAGRVGRRRRGRPPRR